MVVRQVLDAFVTGVNPLTICVLVAVVSLLLLNKVFKGRKLPPGPRGLPVLGYLPFVGNEPIKTFQNFHRKYGNIVGFYLGNRYHVILGDYASIKEALGKEEILARPEETVFHEFANDPSIITINGDPWKDQRRFALHQLRDLGFGKSRLEEHIKEEVSYFIKEIQKQNGKPIDFEFLVSMSTANNISLLLFGRRKEYNDTLGIRMAKIAKEANHTAGPAMFQVYLPKWLAKILSFLPSAQKDLHELRNYIQEMDDILCKDIDEHKTHFDEDNIGDYVDGYLLEMKKRKGDMKTSFNDSHLKGNALILFSAGSDTTRSILNWLMLVMAVYQDVQEKAYKEIVNVIGKEREPSWSDNLQLPYCSAIIAETHRLKTIVPLDVERCASQDTVIQGYDIPKGTVIFSNLWAVHHDPNYWKNPEKFDPTRFLSEDGTKYIKNERLIPFSIGKRSCLGEGMANVEVFLYFTTLIQHFKILPRNPEKKISLKGVFTVGYENVESMDSLYFQKRTE